MTPEPTTDATDESTDDDVTVYETASEILDANALTQLVTPESRAKLIVALLILEGDADSPTSIVERAGLGRNSWYNNRDALLSADAADDDYDGPSYGIMEQEGSIGNSPLYRIKMDDPLVQALNDVLNLARVRRSGDEDLVEAYDR
ncbi:hypothetical protein [Halomarina oriensis]|uniref:Uncharacterized protein n=1 Tax=Halomarina oriensis TaxID=671145 RepID=A0A6B0GLN8_9EURY|nr:hypothetical protein [Halomarina oriensis]MWG34801.1 hypothetical protein [Halomarina oriensis]